MSTAVRFLALPLVGAACACVADSVTLDTGTATYRFDPASRTVAVAARGAWVPILQQAGPVWGETGKPGETVAPLRPADPHHPLRWTCREAPNGAEWQLALRGGADGELVMEMTAETATPSRVSPGMLPAAGAWIGLDLSQYQLAHGQPSWPKTYYLAEADLFVCAWWCWEVSHAVGHVWEAAQCEPRQGNGPCAPAATMVYGPAGGELQAPLREALHIRASSRLWEAALPPLIAPSPYRDELAGLVFLDVWGSRSATEMTHVLGILRDLVVPHVRFLTIIQNWQAGGFDALLPDSIWLPEYPPSPAFGSVDGIRELALMGNQIGRFGLRTNYAFWRAGSPSHRRGLVDRAASADGTPKWHTQPARWEALAHRQETEIAQLWPTSALFIDQLASGGSPQAYLDFSYDGDQTLSGALARQRALARLAKGIHNGPLGSETLNQQDLMGSFCDFGDFSILAGHDRLFPVDYKLRRLHPLTVSYGCGLPYRFFELPPFKQYHAGTLRLWDEPDRMDAYRCCEVMLGNAAYLCWDAPWEWVLTECLVVGRLQQRMARARVAEIAYLHQGSWQDLETLVRGGFAPETRPWRQKQETFGRVRVQYEDGLTVTANRLADALTVATAQGDWILPRSGWIAATPDASLVAGSAFWPGTQQRVDFLEERGASGLRFLNPRSGVIEGSADLRLWQGGTLLWRVDPAGNTARIGDRTIRLGPQPAEAMTALDVSFAAGWGGFRPTAGVLRVEPCPEGQRLAIVTPDPQLLSSPLAISGHADDVLTLDLSVSAGTYGQLYFATAADGISERQVVVFDLVPDGVRRTVTIPVGTHPRWPDQTITRIRLDPVHGPGESTVVLHRLALQRAGPAPSPR